MAETLPKGEYRITNVPEGDVSLRPSGEPGVVHVVVKVSRRNRSKLKRERKLADEAVKDSGKKPCK